MDGRLDDGRVAAQPLAIFDTVVLRVVDEGSIDALQGLGPDELDVALKSRLLRRLVREADQTERPVAL